jgi:predicted small secreted protein
MKKHILICALFLISLYLLNSCCTKVGCLGVDDIRTIKLYNFNSTDFDTIYLLKYDIGNNFTNKLDSNIYNIYNIENRNNEYNELMLNLFINKDFEYKLVFKSINQEYKIKNITSEKNKCNCDYFDALKSYIVKDSLIEDSYLSIYR